MSQTEGRGPFVLPLLFRQFLFWGIVFVIVSYMSPFTMRGGEVASRSLHRAEVAGSSPAPATMAAPEASSSSSGMVTGGHGKPAAFHKPVVYQPSATLGVADQREPVAEKLQLSALALEVEEVAVPPSPRQEYVIHVPPLDKWELMTEAGVPDKDQAHLDYIIINESNWDHTVWSKVDVASYGLGQRNLVVHPIQDGENYMDDPIAQLEWAVNYCIERYGSIEKAREFKEAKGWY